MIDVVVAVVAAVVLLRAFRRHRDLPVSKRDARAQPAQEAAALYEDRWEQVRYLNELDQKSIILVVTALTGAVVSADRNLSLPINVEAALSFLAGVVSGGAIYSVVHNRISMEYALKAIDRLEEQFNGGKIDRETAPPEAIFLYAGGFNVSGTWRQFVKRVMVSIRGPIIVFFSIVLILSFVAFLRSLEQLFHYRTNSWYHWGVSLLVGLTANAIAFTFAWRAAYESFWKRP
jgi:hypothetical protein